MNTLVKRTEDVDATTEWMEENHQGAGYFIVKTKEKASVKEVIKMLQNSDFYVDPCCCPHDCCGCWSTRYFIVKRLRSKHFAVTHVGGRNY